MLADPLDQAGRVTTDRVPGAGDAHQRGGVDEAAAGPGDRGHPLAGGTGRDQEHPVQVVLVGRVEPGACLLHGEVRGDQPRTARRGQVPGEGAHPVPVDRVPVGHDQHRYARRRDCLDGAEHVRDPRPGRQRPVHRLGDHRAVHQRVGVGQAHLDDVGSGLCHGQGRLDGAGHGREPGRQVADQGRAIARARLAEGLGDDTGHAVTPRTTGRRCRRPCHRGRTG